MRTIWFFLASYWGATSVKAQPASSAAPSATNALATASNPATDGEIDWANFDKVLEASDASDWTFHLNQRDMLLLVDLKAMGDAHRLVVTAAGGMVVFEDKGLLDLPANAIYEVDFRQFPKNQSYTVEVYTTSDNQPVRHNVSLPNP